MGESEQAANKSGVFDDLVEMFFAPTRVFERRRDGRYGTLLGLLVLITLVLMIATMSITAPYWDAQFDLSLRQAAERGQAMPEGAGADAARGFGRWAGAIAASVFIPIFVWIGALFVMLGGKLAGASISYRQGATIFTLAGIPRLLSPIAMAVQGLVVDPATVTSINSASLGPARFFDPNTTSASLLSVLANFDVINLWAFALIGIGISVMGRVSRGNGYLGSVIVFLGVLALSLLAGVFS